MPILERMWATMTAEQKQPFYEVCKQESTEKKSVEELKPQDKKVEKQNKKVEEKPSDFGKPCEQKE